jgi:hypothetical protein
VIPSSFVALIIVVAAVLPGATYMWGFERQVTSFGVTLADRVLRFMAVSVSFHLLLGWIEYFAFRSVVGAGEFRAGHFVAVWLGTLALVLIPFGSGTVLGGLYASRGTREGWRWIRGHLSAKQEARLLGLLLGRDPAPRAWDSLFSERPTAYIRVRTVTGEWLGGLFADKSYASGLPHEPDLLLEEAWELSGEGELHQPLGYASYIPAGQVSWLEILPPGQEVKEKDSG